MSYNSNIINVYVIIIHKIIKQLYIYSYSKYKNALMIINVMK